MAFFSKKLPQPNELWLFSLRKAALTSDDDPACRFVYPPAGGLAAGAMCGGVPKPDGAHPHEYWGPRSITLARCDQGHAYAVATAFGGAGCQFCHDEAQVPGWKPQLEAWASFPPEYRP